MYQDIDIVNNMYKQIKHYNIYIGVNYYQKTGNAHIDYC